MPAPKRRRRCSPPQLLSLIAGALAPAHHDPAALVRLLPPVALEAAAGPGRALGPAGGRRKTLVLDLDETLLHSMHSRPVAPVDMSLMVPSPSLLRFRFRRSSRAGHHRGHVGLVLRALPPARAPVPRHGERRAKPCVTVQVARWYEVVIFTASLPQYGAPVIDALDPERRVTRRFYRDVSLRPHCATLPALPPPHHPRTCFQTAFLARLHAAIAHAQSCTPMGPAVFAKDLALVQPDLASVVIVDNSPSAYMLHPGLVLYSAGQVT